MQIIAQGRLRQRDQNRPARAAEQVIGQSELHNKTSLLKRKKMELVSTDFNSFYILELLTVLDNILREYFRDVP